LNSSRIDLNKLPVGAVIGELGFSREEAGRQLSMASMVGDALAAYAFSGARLISAIADLHVAVEVIARLGRAHQFSSCNLSL